MTKIVILGAGSAVFAQQMVTDVLCIAGLDAGEFALVDIDPLRLELAHQLAEMAVQKSGKAFHITATTNRLEALPNTDFVISCIEVSGLENVQHDYQIPLKYGVDQCIGDTIGPGGLFKFLRTAPSWHQILRDIERICPRAVVMNYTNPMSALVLLATRATPLQVIGLCHSVQGTAQQIAGYLGVEAQKLRYECAGINHLSWFTRLEVDGQDVYPDLMEKAKVPEIHEQDPVRFEMLLQLGAFTTESSGHVSEYTPYFRKRKDLIERHTRAGYRGESGYYAHNWPLWRANHDQHARETIQQGLDALELERSHEFGSQVIEALTLGRPQVIHGNVKNTGLIENLPQGGCVEVACLLDANGIQPTHFGRLPEHLAALDRQHMAFHELAVEAVLQEDREAAVHALMLDPLTAAVCSLQEARSMFDELVEAQQAHLPAFLVRH